MEIYHKRLLSILTALTLVFYLSTTAGLYLWLARNPHNQVEWGDLALPWHWRDLRARLGDTAILDAQENLEQRDYASAYSHLRGGLARSPGNARGRVLLAQLIAGSDPLRALELMEEGLPYSAHDIGCLRELASLYQQHQALTRGLAAFDRLLASPGQGALPEDARNFLVNTRAEFLLAAGRPAEALQTLTASEAPPPAHPEAGSARQLIMISALLRLGRAKEARPLLEQALAGPGPARPEVIRLEAEFCLACNDADHLGSALRRLKAVMPADDPQPYLFAFSCWHRLRRPLLREAAETEFYQYFGTNERALQLFAVLLGSLDLDDTIRRVRSRAMAAGWSGFAYQVHLTEALLRRGDFEQASRLLREWEGSTEKLAAPQRFYPEFVKRLTRVAATGTDEQAEALARLLAENRALIQPALYELTVGLLMQWGRLELSHRVLHLALASYPYSDPLLARQAAVEQRLAVARPAEAAVAVSEPAVTPLPATAKEALAALDSLLQQDSLGAARDLLGRIRRDNPAWLPDQEAPLAVREIQLLLSAADAGASRALIRQYLARHLGDDDAALALVTLAQNLAARQRTAEARLLHDEILTSSGTAPRVAAALRSLGLPDDLKEELAGRETALRALDRWLDAGQWSQAERLLERLRGSPPDWAAEARIDLRAREVRLRLGLEQKPAALLAFREIVLPSGAARFAAFRLVRDYRAKGEPLRALLLAEETVRLLPGDKAAEKLLQEARAGLPPPELPPEP